MKKYCIIFSLFISLNAFAQYTPPIINYTKNQYQGQFQNWDIDQSNDFNIFIANSAGLISYNGINWSSYKLPHRQIVRTVKCIKDKIYIGSYGDFAYFEKDFNGIYKYHSLINKVQNKLPIKEEIWKIIEFGNAILFQSFSTIYKYENDTIKISQPPGNIMFLNQVGERILFQEINGGLFEMIQFDNYRFLDGSELFANKHIVQILQGPIPDSFIIVTENSGIFIYHKKVFRPWNDNNILKTSQLNKAILLSSGKYAIGCIQNGVFIINSDSKINEHYYFENGLQNNTVLSLKEDVEGDLWVGTDKGVDLVLMSSDLRFFKNKTDRVGTVYDIENFNNEIYIGTNKGVFYSVNNNSDFKLIEKTQGQVWDLKVYDDRLFCGHNNGTFIIENHKATEISEVNGGWDLIQHPKNPNILLQATYSGISVFRKNKEKVWYWSNRIEGFDFPINKIVFDNAGWIWATHPIKSLFRVKLDLLFNRAIKIETYGENDGLEDLYNIKLAKVEDTIIFISNSKVYEFNNKDNKFYKIDKIANRFIDEKMNDIIYFNSSQNAFVYNKKVSLNYEGREYDFQLELIPHYEKIKKIDNTIYFCLEDGFAKFQNSTNNKYKTIDYNSPRIFKLEILGSNSCYKYNNDKINILKPNENNIKFHFGLPIFNRQVKYSHFLKGHDTIWSGYESFPSIEYINLKKGKYTFMLKSDQSDEIKSINIEILPKWYESSFGYFMFFILIFGTLIIFYIYFNQKFKKEKIKLEKEKKEHLEKEKIKNKNKLLEKDILLKNKDLANTTINLARKNETLLEILEKLKEEKENLDQNRKVRLLKVINFVKRNINSGDEWTLFETAFNEIHEKFFISLRKKHPNLTSSDQKLAALLKMRLSTKDIAPILRISTRGVENKRYRLRKKLGLDKQKSLINYVSSL